MFMARGRFLYCRSYENGRDPLGYEHFLPNGTFSDSPLCELCCSAMRWLNRRLTAAAQRTRRTRSEELNMVTTKDSARASVI